MKRRSTKTLFQELITLFFPGARAALKTKGIDTKSHQGLITQFALHLVKPGLLETEYGDILRQEKEDRESSDYESFSSFSLEEARKRVKDAEQFIRRIQKFMNDSGFKLTP